MAYENTQPRPGTTRTRSGNPHKGKGGDDGTQVAGLASPPGTKQATSTHYPHTKSGPAADARSERRDHEGFTTRGYARNERTPETRTSDASAGRVTEIPAP